MIAPRGWLTVAEAARARKVPHANAKRCVVEGLVASVRSGETSYVEPDALARAFLALPDTWPKSRRRVAEALRLTDVPARRKRQPPL